METISRSHLAYAGESGHITTACSHCTTSFSADRRDAILEIRLLQGDDLPDHSQESQLDGAHRTGLAIRLPVLTITTHKPTPICHAVFRLCPAHCKQLGQLLLSITRQSGRLASGLRSELLYLVEIGDYEAGIFDE